jgi:hypothetical protein
VLYYLPNFGKFTNELPKLETSESGVSRLKGLHLELCKFIWIGGCNGPILIINIGYY